MKVVSPCDIADLHVICDRFLIRDDSRLGQSIEESKDGPIVMYRSMAGGQCTCAYTSILGN